MAVSSFVTLKVYDFLGKEVATLVNEEKQSGKYSVKFDTTSSGGNKHISSSLPSGVYYYTMTAGSFRETKKMMLLK